MPCRHWWWLSTVSVIQWWHHVSCCISVFLSNSIHVIISVQVFWHSIGSNQSCLNFICWPLWSSESHPVHIGDIISALKRRFSLALLLKASFTWFVIISPIFILLVSTAFKMFLCGPAGGGYPGGGQPPGPADVAAPPAGFTLHPVLRLQALRREEEEEKKEEEAPQPTRFFRVIAVPALVGTVQDHST